MIHSNERLAKIAGFVRQYLQESALRLPSAEHDALYRWQHTLRVAGYGKLIAEGEGANIELVMAACLLHDVSHFDLEEDYSSHGRRGAQLCRPLLVELGFSLEEVDAICYAIAVHVDGNAGFDHPETIEAKAVSDADNVDRFGAYRILQWCVHEMADITVLAEKLSRRLLTLEKYRLNNPLETATGQEIFSKQLDRQIEFFKEILAERELTQMPEL